MQSYYKRKIVECYESARQANEAGDKKEMNRNLNEASVYESEVSRDKLSKESYRRDQEK